MARERRARKVLYDSDATVITENESVDTGNVGFNAQNVSRMSMKENGVEVKMEDLFDTLVAYSPYRWFGSVKGVGTGTCVICGKSTCEDIRKICGECMDKFHPFLYRKGKEVLKDGERSINI